MKTKTFFILCLVSGFGLTQLNAQNGKDGTGTLSIQETSDGYWLDIPVNCDDQEIERLTGSCVTHTVFHFEKGTPHWLKFQMTAKLTSIRNDEVFQIKEIAEVDLTDPTLYMGHCNLRGDKGSHYVLIYFIDYTNWEEPLTTFIKVVCPGNNE